jgi:hypothetical protein
MDENEHIEDIDDVEEVEVIDLDDPEDIEVIDLDDVEDVVEVKALVQEVIALDEVEDLGDSPRVVSSGDERASALQAVLEHQTGKREVVVHRHRSLPPERVAFSYAALAISLAVAFWIWFFPPGWAQRNPISYPTFAQEETSLRLVMFLQAQRIEAFRLENGRLPESLDQAGPPLPGVEYTRLAGQTYYLRGEGDQAYLGYFSSQAIEEFLGDSEDLLNIEVEG